MKNKVFFNEVQPGQQFSVEDKESKTVTLIKMATVCETAGEEKIKFNAIFSDMAEPYPVLFDLLDVVFIEGRV